MKSPISPRIQSTVITIRIAIVELTIIIQTGFIYICIYIFIHVCLYI
jgi:hypothetical protein